MTDLLTRRERIERMKDRGADPRVWQELNALMAESALEAEQKTQELREDLDSAVLAAGGVQDGSIATQHLADSAVTPAKLDRSYAGQAHQHQQSEVQGLDAALASKADASALAPLESKLADIEPEATADQTPIEIRAALLTVDGAGSGIEADLLDGQHASAFATAVQGARADTAVQPADLAPVATSGDYNDLSNTPAPSGEELIVSTARRVLGLPVGAPAPAPPEELDETQVRDIIGTFSPTARGLVPAGAQPGQILGAAGWAAAGETAWNFNFPNGLTEDFVYDAALHGRRAIIAVRSTIAGPINIDLRTTGPSTAPDGSDVMIFNDGGNTQPITLRIETGDSPGDPEPTWFPAGLELPENRSIRVRKIFGWWLRLSDTLRGVLPGALATRDTVDGLPINMTDQVLSRPALQDFSEISPTPSVSAGALTLDLQTGNVFEVTLDANVTSLVLANPPAAGRAGSATLILKQDATGGRTVTWPAAVKWAGGQAPVVTAAANAVDVIAVVTRDGGATWYGFPGGQGFA